MCAHGRRRLMLALFCQSLASLFPGAEFVTGPGACGFPLYPEKPLEVGGVALCLLSFYVGARNLNFILHAHMARALSPFTFKMQTTFPLLLSCNPFSSSVYCSCLPSNQEHNKLHNLEVSSSGVCKTMILRLSSL